MTVVYAAEETSNKGYIKDALLEYEASQPGESRFPKQGELQIMVRAMLAAMREVVPGPIAIMEWIKAEARLFFREERGGEEINWVSPSGFPVRQDKRKPNIRRVKTQLLGDVIQTSIADGYQGPAISKHISGTAPNWIHSADAALLHNSFAGFDQPFCLIHDSILTTATDMGYMSKVIRDEFVKIYKDRPLEQLAKTLGAETPHHLIKGDLDLDSCRASIYFFC